MFEFINDTFDLKDSGCSNGTHSITAARHRWYVIKEGFSPKLVERAISEHPASSEKKVVVDPFCGSGTVPLTAASLGHRGVGLEVNPFMAFVSRTKLLQTKQHLLARGTDRATRMMSTGVPSPLESFSTFSKGGRADKWLFNRSVLRSFEGGWHASESESPNVRSLLRLSLLGAAMDTCNAVRDGKCLRYRKGWEDLKFSGKDVVEAFRNRVAVIAEDLKTTASDGARIARGDCRQRLSQEFEPFDVCVTSPPYLNSFDYSDVYRPELFLGKFVDSNEALRVIRLRTLRSHVQVEWPKPKLDDFGALYRSRIEKLRAVGKSLWSQRIPLMVQAYFEDMTQVLLSLRRRAKPDASLWLVVSTSAYAGVEIPVDLILAEIGMRSGWFLREVGVLRYLRTSGQHWNRWEALAGEEKPQLRESVVILDAKPRGKGKRASGK